MTGSSPQVGSIVVFAGVTWEVLRVEYAGLSMARRVLLSREDESGHIAIEEVWASEVQVDAGQLGLFGEGR